MPKAPSMEKKWVIFDTCAISKILTLGDAIPIISLILKKIGSFTPVVTPLVRFEFLRKANTKNELEKFRKYLIDHYAEIDLISKKDRFSIFQLSSEIGCIYKHARPDHGKHIEAVDCIHGGLLRRYPRNLFLLTFDINDFPEPIFKIVHHQSIRINNKLEIWILVRFNKNGFDRLYSNFKK